MGTTVTIFDLLKDNIPTRALLASNLVVASAILSGSKPKISDDAMKEAIRAFESCLALLPKGRDL